MSEVKSPSATEGHAKHEHRATAPPLSSILLLSIDTERAADFARNFSVILCAQQGNEFQFRDLQTDAAFDRLPQDLAAVILPSGGDLSPAVSTRLRRHLADNGVEVPLVKDFVGVEEILAHSARRIRMLAQRSTRLSFQLAALRKLHEDLQNSYAGIRSIVYDHNLAAPAPTFISTPDPENVAPTQAFGEIVQELPRELRNMCGFSLHLEGVPPAFGEGELEIQLFAPDDDEQRIDWKVPFGSLNTGWVTFVFEQSFRYLRRSAAVRLRQRPRADFFPRFSFGVPSLRPDKAAILDGQRGDRPLALKIWTAPPGAALNITSQIWPAYVSGQASVSRIELALDDALGVEEVTDTSTRVSFPTVKVFQAERRILVHPLGEEATIARLPSVCPPRTREVIAEFSTLNERAGPVAYGLASSPAGAILDAAALKEMVAGVDWMTIPHSSTGRLALDAQPSEHERRDLYLLTRLPAGCSSDFCWASFTRIYFRGNFL